MAIETTNANLPVAIIGGGPVGLAAAAHLLARGEEPLVLEAGPRVGSSIREWGHVRLFSPWRYVVDSASAELLKRMGWEAPAPSEYPTGRDLVERYLEPLAATPELAPRIRLGARVESVTRLGFDKMKTAGREKAPFLVQVRTADGREEAIRARAVIDASGTWARPNPLGASGLPAVGERALAERIFYGIPDVLGVHRNRYAGRRVMVVGSGHSAFNALLDLVALAGEAPGTEIVWAVRRADLGQVFGGGQNDALAARGELGTRVRNLVESGRVRIATGFRIAELWADERGVTVVGESDSLPPVDEIIATTGFRPDLSPLSELRLALDPVVESPIALAPLIDPNLHSCGTVRPHGAQELKHPEEGFYIVGMKSYGRAPTFLLLTGYEQVRSVAAALTGDWKAAREVHLELPETGVCSLAPLKEAVDKVAACCTPSPIVARIGASCC
jgi:thioredoxin reductase